MRAPFCPDSSDVCPEEQGLIADNDTNQIQALERSLERRNSNKSAVFGIGLESLMGMSPQVAPQIPFVLSRICRYLEASGLHHKNIFMENDEKNLVEMLKTEFKESGDASLEAAGNVTSAAKLLLVFFEELPEPLIPLSIQPIFINNMDKLSLSSIECINHLKYGIEQLPDTTFLVLKYLSRFLLRVACHQEYNGMSSDNLALIFGPIIFRLPPDDSANLIPVKNIMNCFVSEYYAIFEDGISHQDNDNLKSAFSNSESLSIIHRKQIPCPSSVMPLMSLSPLSVVIPSIESEYKSSDANEDPNRNVPILLIERQMESTPEEENEKNPEFEMPKDIIGVLPTRKRKERRLSGEDVQMQRSSSEERPSLATTLSFDKNELMRRCSSHEEMAEGVKRDLKFDSSLIKKATIKEAENLEPADSYFADSMENVLNEKDHSPHPPNAKRREVELPNARQSDLNAMDSYSISGSRIQDCVVLPWKNNVEVAHSDGSNSAHIDKPLNLDVTCSYDLKQNSLTELELESMDYGSPKKVDEDGEPADLDSKKVGLPRSASCPVPKTENDSSESESSSLSLSWSMLFETENTEPLRSEHRYSWPLTKEVQDDDTLLSPSVQNLRKSNFYEAPLSPSAYRSYLSYRSTHLDASIPPSPPVEQEDFAKSLVDGNAVADSIKQLTKKIHSLKKRIKRFDENFESEFGYKPSHAEKAIHPDAKKLMNDLHKARKELKALKEESHLEQVGSGTNWHPTRDSHILGDTTNSFLNDAAKDKPKPTFVESVDETLKTLDDDRKNAKRPDAVEEMTNEQIKEEKLAIQKALLHFESIHGRPTTKSDRNTIRPLYERYRCVKKLLVRSGSFPSTSSKNKDSCSELQPILEHETMDFTSPQHRTSMESAIVSLEEEINDNEKKVHKPEITADEPKSGAACSQFLMSKYDNSNIHELPLSEMIFQMQKAKSEKRHLRKILREFEVEFQRLNGRKVQKEDKAPVEALYGEYKHVKARLKLLEALISKHDQHQLM